MATLSVDEARIQDPDPLDLVEHVILSQGWPYERPGEDEITAAVSGQWCDYQLRFFWREEGRILQTACLFDARVAEVKRAAIYETIALVNEHMWMGHFEVWSEDGMVMFRHASFLGESGEISSTRLAETLIETAVAECERYYPVFQFVIWAGKSPAEAIEAAMLETAGEA